MSTKQPPRLPQPPRWRPGRPAEPYPNSALSASSRVRHDFRCTSSDSTVEMKVSINAVS